MSAIREATREDVAALERLLARVPCMPAAAREAAWADVSAAIRETVGGPRCLLVHDDATRAARAFVVLRPVPLARRGVEISWLVADAAAEDDVASSVRALVASALASSDAVRFVGGRWHRGGLAAHVLDAAGLERLGVVRSFYGRGDDMLVFGACAPASVSDDPDPVRPAALYDAAFGYRDFDAECSFLLACAERFGARRVRRAASWACGAGRHVRALAARGVEGLGIDESEGALALAEERAAVDDAVDAVTTRFVLGRLDEPVDEPSVDLSYAMLSTVHRVGSVDALVRHLRAVAALLAPGGVHVIEATHPADAAPSGNTRTVWTERRGGHELVSRFEIHVGRRTRAGALPATLDVTCRAAETGELEGALHQEELWIVPEADTWRSLVARAGGLDLVAMLGDLRLDVAWDQPGAWRMIVVLRRTDS